MSRNAYGFVASLAAAAVLSVFSPAVSRAQDKKDKAADKPAAEEKPADLTPGDILKDPKASKGKKIEWPVTILEARAVQFQPPEFILVMVDKDNKILPGGEIYVQGLMFDKGALAVYEGGREKGKNARFKLKGEVLGTKKTTVAGKGRELPELKATLILVSK